MTAAAKTVVFDADNHVFDVDGKSFPWYLPESARPRALQVADDLYFVWVQFYAVLRGDMGKLPCTFSQTAWNHPVICGVEFPWWITVDGLRYSVSRKNIPIIELAFFAESVEGLEVLRSEQDFVKVRKAGGQVIRT